MMRRVTQFLQRFSKHRNRGVDHHPPERSLGRNTQHNESETTGLLAWRRDRRRAAAAPYGTEDGTRTTTPPNEEAPFEDSSSSSFLVAFTESKKGAPQIAILIVLLAFAFGSIVGVVPAIMTDRYARLRHGYTDALSCAEYAPRDKPDACFRGSADAQDAVAVEQLVANGLTFVTSSTVGSISDLRGRKGVLLVGILLTGLSPLVLLLTQLDPRVSPLVYYTVGALQGLVNWVAIALSALSDVTPPQWRAASFGVLLGGFSLGFTCAPTLALWLGHFNVTIFSLTLSVTAFFFMLGCVPETLPPAAAEQAKRMRALQMADYDGHWWDQLRWSLYRPLWELSILNRNGLFRLLTGLAFFSGISASGDQSLLLYYAEERLGFNDQDVVTLFLILGVFGIFCQGVLLKLLNDCIGERLVVVLSFGLGALQNVINGYASTKKAIFVSAALAAMAGMAFPTISAIKSNNVDQSEQGRIQGALYSAQALASALGPLGMRSLDSWSKNVSYAGPGFMFVFPAVVYAVAAICGYFLPENSKRNPNSAVSDEHGPSKPTTFVV